MKCAYVADGARERRDLLSGERGARRGEFGLRHGERLELPPTAAPGQRAQPRIPVALHGTEDLPHHGDRGRGEGGLRTLERGPPLGGIELLPVEDAYHASIFSTGNTRSALAPACFSRSSV